MMHTFYAEMDACLLSFNKPLIDIGKMFELPLEAFTHILKLLITFVFLLKIKVRFFRYPNIFENNNKWQIFNK